MVAFRLSSFGGMVPAVDDRLLPDNAAVLAKNTWLYNGNISGFKAPRFIRNLVSSTAKRVFRIPNNPLEKTNYNNSVWMEFQDPTVTVIRAPMLQDSYSRYYWCGKDTPPTYNTLARIQAGSAPLTLGVPAPAEGPSVRAGSGYLTILEGETYVGAYNPAVLKYNAWTPYGTARTLKDIGRSSNVAIATLDAAHGYKVDEYIKITPTKYNTWAYVNGTTKFISNVARTSGVSTITTTAAHGYTIGQTVSVEPVTNAAYSKTGTQFTINSVSRANGVVTAVTTAAHSFDPGERVRVSGVGASAWDGDYIVTSVPTTTSFTYTKSGADTNATAVTGTAIQLTTGFAGRFTITEVPTTTTFRFNQSGAANVTSTADTGSVLRTTTGFEGVYKITEVPSTNTIKFTSTGADVKSVADTGAVSKVELRTTTNSTGTTVYGNNTSGTPDEAIINTRAYVYTYVTEYGEEGPPSPPTLRSGVPTEPWYLKFPTVPSSVTNNRRIEKIRIYRTITSAAGAATYYQVDEIPIAQSLYTDNTDDTEITSNNILESETWTEPPATLKGWVSMPNGIIAAWKDNEVWFCEPYRPHAWPVQYQVSVDYPIVGLGVMGQTLIIATTGTPWAATGIRPASMTLAKINTFEPCQSRLSIMSTPEAVMYASPNGLVAAVPGAVRVVTSELINPDEWQSFHDLSKLQSVRFGSAYMAFETPSTGTTSKGFMIEAGQPRVSYNALENASAGITAIDIDPWSSSALIIRNGAIYVWDQPDNTSIETYLWRSKVFQLPALDNLGAMKVFFTVPTGVSAPYGVVRVYADDRLVMTRNLVTSGEEMRLPSGFTAHTYQVEVEARVIVHNIQVATTSRELRSV